MLSVKIRYRRMMWVMSFAILILCSCNPVSTASTKPTIEFSTPSHPSTIPYAEASIDCKVYIQSQWGSGPTQFGYYTSSDGQNEIHGPYSPTFDELGNMFIADPVNQCILMYPVGLSTPQSINVPSSYILNYNSNDRYWSNVSASNGVLYLVYSVYKNGRTVRQLAALSFDGHEKQVIDLEPYYPLYADLSSPVMADRHGGIYLVLHPSVGIVHFDTDFRSELIQEVGTSFFDQNAAVGWNGNLYTYDFTADILYDWGQSDKTILIANKDPVSSVGGIIQGAQDKEPTYGKIIGADSDANIFLSFNASDGNLRIIRLNGNDRAIASIPAEWAMDIMNLYNISLAPDGALYSLIYDPADQSVQPKIIKCEFKK